MKSITITSALAVALLPLLACTPASTPDDQIDLIVDGQTVVTMDADGTIYEDGAVAVDDGIIVAIGARDDIHARYSAVEVLGGTDRIVMPGLINGHSHAAMTLLRGVADDLALMDIDLIQVVPRTRRLVARTRTVAMARLISAT